MALRTVHPGAEDYKTLLTDALEVELSDFWKGRPWRNRLPA